MNLYTSLITKEFTKDLPTKADREHIDNLVKLATRQSNFTTISVELLELVAKETGVTYAQILGKRRLRPVCDARHVISGLLYESGRYGYTFIGRALNRDHATIINSVRRCKNLIEVDKVFRAKFIRCKSRLIATGFLEQKIEGVTDSNFIKSENVTPEELNY